MRRFVLPALSTLLCLSLLAPAASAQLAAYWLSDPACSQTVQPPGTSAYDQRIQTTMPPLVRRSTGVQPEWVEERYVLDADGDLCLHSVTTYDPAVSLDTQVTSYDPPLKILDYPLTTDKTWTATTTRFSTGVGLPRPLERTGTVVGPRTVETVLGPLPVIEVAFESTYRGTTSSWTCLLNEQLGEVSDLVAVDGCDAVPTTDTSWSRLKADYR